MLSVIAMVAHNHSSARSVRDLGADDEGWYLGSGVLLGHPGFPNGAGGLPIPEQGPMYSLWYFVLSKVWDSRLDLYFASWQLLATALSLAIYVVMRRAGAPWWQALLGTFFYVNSVVADVWPFPTYFATLLVLLGVLLASRARTTMSMLCIVTVALAFAGFARPEMLAAYGAAVVVVLVHGLREARRSRDLRRSGVAAVAALAPGGLLFGVFGNPLAGMRSFYAFAQHYTLNLFAAEGSPLDPWAHWGEIVTRDFPGTWTVGQAMRANPSAFVAHVLRNVRLFPKAFLGLTDSLDASVVVQCVVAIIGLFFAHAQLRRCAREVRTNVVIRALFFALACCAVPFFFACLVIYPRAHYFVPVSVITVALVFSAPFVLPARTWQPSPAQRWAGVLATCALFVVLTGSKGAQGGARAVGERQRTVVTLQELKLQGRVVILEESWGTCMYAGYDCESHLRYEKELPFDAFVKKLGLEVLVIDDTLPRDPHFTGDLEFEDFLRNPARHGFRLLDVPRSRTRIALRLSGTPGS